MAMRLWNVTLSVLLTLFGQQLELMLAQFLLMRYHVVMVFVADVRIGQRCWRLGWMWFWCTVIGVVSFGDLLLLEVDALSVPLRILAAWYGFTFFGETEFFRLVDGRPELEPTVFQCFVKITVVVKGFLLEK